MTQNQPAFGASPLRPRPIIKASRSFFIGLLLVFLLYVYMVLRLDIHLMAHGLYDSYTLQALAWRAGRLNLLENDPSLELAFHQGQIFVCFPPVPAIPMLFLSFFFGAQTPSVWLMTACFFGSYVAAYRLGVRLGNADKESALWAAFLVCGSNLIDISLFGWVWYMAQGCAFLLTLLAFDGALSSTRKGQALGLVCIALAVGCRPMQVIYAPILMWMVWKRLPNGGFSMRLRLFLPLLILPVLIGLSYGIYNGVRFGDPFEFGYNYLPEFQKDAQFGLHYVPKHLKKLFFDFPYIDQGRLILPDFDGFAFYIANPIFILLSLRLLRRPRGRPSSTWPLLFVVALHFFLLMLHRTFGGWQFGTRYLLDTLPAVFYLCLQDKKSTTRYESPVMVFGVLVNVLGSLLFRTAYPDFLITR